MNYEQHELAERKAAAGEKPPSPAGGGRAAAKKRRGGRSTRNEDGSLNAVNLHVGGRLRLRRLQLGMSQGKLSRALGLTYQQVQKYENGLSEVKASRLFDLARVLDVPVGFFFDDMAAAPGQPGPGSPAGEETGPGGPEGSVHQQVTEESVELVKAYYGIADAKLRRQVYEMARALSAEGLLTPER